ncbi:MAG TPA: phosphoribosylglycinamide formyltransferase [Solirubrobacteraceae bacterium]|nr:phosphoribosylglycinamide formyltransferase [Solirubrobacteraceae bacterium]
MKLAVLASGAGSNLQALIDTVHGHDGIRIVAVGSDKASARALVRAADAGIPTAVFPAADFGGDRVARDRAMAAWLAECGAELVVLAGYMQLVSGDFLTAFPDRVINVHPALLPAFPGLDAVGQALAYGVKVFGVTVHFVDAGVDSGSIILQRAVELPDARSAEEVLGVLHAIEHELLPAAVRHFATGAVRREPGHSRRVIVG